jgi:hypothetical protein
MKKRPHPLKKIDHADHSCQLRCGHFEKFFVPQLCAVTASTVSIWLSGKKYRDCLLASITLLGPKPKDTANPTQPYVLKTKTSNQRNRDASSHSP